MAMLLICCLLTAFLPSAFAETAQREDRLSVTHHTTEIQGKEIAYTVTAGTMAMSTSLGDYDLFFTAYTLDGVEDPAARPTPSPITAGRAWRQRLSIWGSWGRIIFCWTRTA